MRYLILLFAIFFDANAQAQAGANQQIKQWVEENKPFKYKSVNVKNDNDSHDEYCYRKPGMDFFACQKYKDGWIKKFIFVNNELRYVAYFLKRDRRGTMSKGGMYVFEKGVMTAVDEEGIEPFSEASLLEEAKAILEKSVSLQPKKK